MPAIERILRAIEAAGMLTVKLSRNVWLIPVPTVMDTVKTINATGFSPYEQKEKITAARCVILGFGTHAQPDIKWKAIGANYWRVTDEADAVEALAEVGVDIRKALET